MSEQDERLAISVKNQCTEKERADNLVIYKLTLKVTSTLFGGISYRQEILLRRTEPKKRNKQENNSGNRSDRIGKNDVDQRHDQLCPGSRIRG